MATLPSLSQSTITMRMPASAALLRLPDELVARVIDHLGGGFGVMRASVMRALVDCSAAAPALAEHVELLAARAWTARTGAADARRVSRRRRWRASAGGGTRTDARPAPRTRG